MPLPNLNAPVLTDNNKMLMETLEKVNRHGLAAIVTLTQVKVVKKSRITKLPTPSKFINLRKVVYATVSFHHDYQGGVQNRQIKVGSTADPFLTEKPNGKHHYSDNGIVLQADRDDNIMYAQYYCNFNPNVKNEVIYIDEYDMQVDVTKANKGEYFYGYEVNGDKPESKKQKDGGIEKKDQIIVRAPFLESIQYFAKGEDKTFNRLSDAVKDLLNLV